MKTSRWKGLLCGCVVLLALVGFSVTLDWVFDPSGRQVDEPCETSYFTSLLLMPYWVEGGQVEMSPSPGLWMIVR